MNALKGSTLFGWLCCYIAGIIVFIHEIEIPFITVGVVLMCILLVGLFSKVKKYSLPMFFAISFLVIGYLSVENYFPHRIQEAENNEVFFIGSIEQQISKDKDWNSSIVLLNKIRIDSTTWEDVNERIVLITEKQDLLIDKEDQLLFKTELLPIQLTGNPGEFNSVSYWLSKGIRYQGFTIKEQVRLFAKQPSSWFENLLDNIRSYSEQQLTNWVGERHAPLINAMLIGDKSDLDFETKRVFTNTGTMHMLAVSGLHIGVIVMLLTLFFKYLTNYRMKKISLWLIVLILWFYAFLTGFSASVVRAVLMFTILIFSGFLKRDNHSINSLCIAAFIILALNPLSILDIGMQLSFLAMLGIFTVYPYLEKIYDPSNVVLKNAWQGTAIGLAAQVFTVPISLYYFNQFPNYFMLSNLGVMLFSGVLLGFAIALLAVGKIAFIAFPIGWVLATCSAIFIGFIAYIERLPGNLSVGFTPHWLWVIGIYVAIFLSLYWLEKRFYLRIIMLFIPFILWLQWDRYLNLSKEEWVVFNTRFPTMIIHQRNKQLCLYMGKEKGLKQAKRLVSDYQKIHAGTCQFVAIEDGKYQLNIKPQHQLDLSVKNKTIRITSNNEKFVVSSDYSFKSEDLAKDEKLIALSNQQLSATYYALANGAFRKNGQ